MSSFVRTHSLVLGRVDSRYTPPPYCIQSAIEYGPPAAAYARVASYAARVAATPDGTHRDGERMGEHGPYNRVAAAAGGKFLGIRIVACSF